MDCKSYNTTWKGQNQLPVFKLQAILKQTHHR
jgi:hypothetical protein